MSVSKAAGPVRSSSASPVHLQVVEGDEQLNKKVESAVLRSQEFLLGLQKPEGYWVAELKVDCTLVSDHILFMHWLREVDVEQQDKCVKHILEEQLPDGGWNIYPKGPSELNATVKAYLALKLAGYAAEHPVMRRGHSTILRLGGIPKCNTYCKLALALVGLFPWEHLPIIPVELILLPKWSPFNIYEMSSWSRAMVIPLSIINHFKPTRHLPEHQQLHELFPYGTEYARFSLPWSSKVVSWQNFFLCCDVVLKFLDRLRPRPFRARALRAAENWLIKRIEPGSDGLAAIFPAIMYSIIAMEAMGYPADHPLYRKACKDYTDLQVDDRENSDFRIQPCFSPIWDTAITAVALAESGSGCGSSRPATGC